MINPKGSAPMADRNLDLWVGDQLHTLLGVQLPLPTPHQFGPRSLAFPSRTLIAKAWATVAGYAQNAVVAYVLALAKKSTNSSTLAAKLVDEVRTVSPAFKL